MEEHQLATRHARPIWSTATGRFQNRFSPGFQGAWTHCCSLLLSTWSGDRQTHEERKVELKPNGSFRLHHGPLRWSRIFQFRCHQERSWMSSSPVDLENHCTGQLHTHQFPSKSTSNNAIMGIKTNTSMISRRVQFLVCDCECKMQFWRNQQVFRTVMCVARIIRNSWSFDRRSWMRFPHLPRRKSARKVSASMGCQSLCARPKCSWNLISSPPEMLIAPSKAQFTPDDAT